MQTTIAWSFNLLNDREHDLLLALAVFVSGLTLTAAEIVYASDRLPADEINVVLGRLVDKSIVQVASREIPRYRLLEPVRHYCLERLTAEGRYEEAVRRHVAWIAGLADAWNDALNTLTDQTIAHDVAAEMDNVRAVLDRLIAARSHASSALAA